MDDRTMYMCMEIIALINLLRGKIVPPPPPPPPPKKSDRPAPSLVNAVHQNLLLGSIIHIIAIKPVIGKFEMHMSRPLPHVYRLSRPAIGNCTYA